MHREEPTAAPPSTARPPTCSSLRCCSSALAPASTSRVYQYTSLPFCHLCVRQCRTRPTGIRMISTRAGRAHPHSHASLQAQQHSDQSTPAAHPPALQRLDAVTQVVLAVSVRPHVLPVELVAPACRQAAKTGSRRGVGRRRRAGGGGPCSSRHGARALRWPTSGASAWRACAQAAGRGREEAAQSGSEPRQVELLLDGMCLCNWRGLGCTQAAQDGPSARTHRPLALGRTILDASHCGVVS